MLTDLLPEVLYFVVMMAVFLLMSSKLVKMPISIAMVCGAVAGALVSGNGFAFRHLIEGTFSYIGTIITIATATIFMKSLQMSGALDAFSALVIKKFHKIPFIMILLIEIVVMFPGMLTGSSTAAVLSAGSVMTPVLLNMGVPAVPTAMFIAMAAIYGKVAPPVNIAAMTIAASADTPYVGFTAPLIAMVIPLVLITALFMVRYVKHVNYDDVKDKLNTEIVEKYGVRIYLPVIVLVVLILVIQVFKLVDDTGMPPLFLVAALVGCFTGRKVNPLIAARDACADVLPVMGNLMGIGSFVQIMTLNGARGMITTYCLALPVVLRYVAMGTVIPAFSGISSLGAATVLGIPFILAFLGNNEIIVSCALSLLCAVGDVMPPSALAGQFSARLANVDKYSKVLKACLPFVVLCVVYGLLMVIFANQLGKLF